MGRESRQSRRAKERRQQQQTQRRGTTSQSNRWSMIVGGIVVLLVVAVLAGFVISNNSSSSVAAKATGTAIAQLTPVANIGVGPVQCSYSEMTGPNFYHVHGHLAIYHNGQPVTVPAQIGFDSTNDCLYWTHTHDTTGIIHIESPYKIVPTLGQFFKVWGQPLTSSRIASVHVKPGTATKTFVDERSYPGDPASIPLKAHTDVTIEIGPPFSQPKRFKYHGL